jgi:hypothetical protein
MGNVYPILPDIRASDGSQISSSFTYINSPSHSLLQSFRAPLPIYLHVYVHTPAHWLLVDTIFLSPYSYHCFLRAHYPSYLTSTLVIIPSFSCNLASTTSLLPSSSTVLAKPSFIAQRGSYAFHIDDSSSSFMGEYPQQMLINDRGSFLSHNLISSFPSPPSLSYLILLNIQAKSTIFNVETLSFIDPCSHSILYSAVARRNSFTVLDLRLVNELSNNSPYLISCPSASFIPLFLNYDPAQRRLSLEHTHPPSEQFWGYSKFKLASRLKNIWGTS